MERNLKNNPVGWTIILTAAILSAIVALGPNFVLRVLPEGARRRFVRRQLQYWQLPVVPCLLSGATGSSFLRRPPEIGRGIGHYSNETATSSLTRRKIRNKLAV